MQPALAHQPVMVSAALVEPLAEPGMGAMLPDMLAVQVQPLLKCHPESWLQTCMRTLLPGMTAFRVLVCESTDNGAWPLLERRAAVEVQALLPMLFVPQEPPAQLEPAKDGLGHSPVPPPALLELAAGGLGKDMAAASLLDAKCAVMPTDEVVASLCIVRADQAPPVALVTYSMG